VLVILHARVSRIPGVQAVAVLTTIAFVGVGSFAIISALRLVMKLRISSDAEVAGSISARAMNRSTVKTSR